MGREASGGRSGVVLDALAAALAVKHAQRRAVVTRAAVDGVPHPAGRAHAIVGACGVQPVAATATRALFVEDVVARTAVDVGPGRTPAVRRREPLAGGW
jgi:hypothetical protein